MKYKVFEQFAQEVTDATAYAPIWRHREYWSALTKKQSTYIAAILEEKPEVLKMDRYGKRVYQFPTGGEWSYE